MNKKVLLVEDEAPIADSIEYSLKNDGFDVVIARNGIAGLTAARNMFPSIIILDLMLPDISGMDLCRILRRETNIPIIILTAKAEEVDRIMGLEFGADDYITKPFSARELIARIRAVLRRSKNTLNEDSKTRLTAGDIIMDIPKRSVTIRDNRIHLPLKQFELLKTFMIHPDEALTRNFLFQTVWNSDSEYDTGTLDVHIRWLREKIENDPAKPDYIRTIRRVGYKFVAG
ncbi:MAG: response regulator transcription factor [Armatimonadota bacterium]